MSNALFLALAESCGARLTGKPDGSEPVTVVFTIDAWRKFDQGWNAKTTITREQVQEVVSWAPVYADVINELARAAGVPE